jgi:hypothetical protein
VAVAELAYSYPGPSVVRRRDTGIDLLLATSGGTAEAGPVPHPHFFSGRLTDPAPAAAGMLACAAVARSRYFLSGSVIAILRDPVVTSGGDRLRFESFSSCGGVHSRLDLLPGAFEVPPLASGTTNVDFNDSMRAALAGAAVTGPLLLHVGSEEFAVDVGSGSVTERKVPLPDRWLKGFGEVQALARDMQLVGELTGAAALRFVRSVPRTARRPLWAFPAGGALALAVTAPANTVAACVAGPHRLAELEPLLGHARRLRVYGPAVEVGAADAPSAWELDLGSARFTLTLSPQTHRGFSGEGALLGLLADEDVAVDALELAGALGWDACVDVDGLAAATGLDRQRVLAALGYLAASGRVGYDLAEQSFFRRELPFGVALEFMHPRLVSARELVASGAVIAFAGGAIVGTADTRHRVVLGPPDRCTCVWWGKHQGTRGPCKHVLAARIATRIEE